MKAFLAGSAKRWGLPQQHGGGNEKTPSFLEKKKQKTFNPPPLSRLRPWPEPISRRGNKSLFASFPSEKEDSSFRFSVCCAIPLPDPCHKAEGTWAGII